MKVYKEKQFLIFDFEDGKTVKYDFATKRAIGVKGGYVKDLKSQLRGMTTDQLFDYCVDKQYAKFLNFIKRKNGTPISNIGTILSKVPENSHYEQIFSAGIEDIIDPYYFSYKIDQIPKSLIKVAKTHAIKISNKLVKYYSNNPDGYYLAFNLDYVSLTDSDIIEILSCEHYEYVYEKNAGVYNSYFNKLIYEYGYTSKSLLLYIDKIKTFEAIEDMRFLIRELFDYAKMMKKISAKFDKYPRNLLTTHRIASRNYNRLSKQFEEDKFKQRIREDLEFKYKHYCFVYPKSTQDIKDEAVQQNNCVASYIDDVINGSCHIMFLRKDYELNSSLVTLEIKNNKIVQAKRRFNDPITEEDREAIEAWEKNFAIKKEKIA